MANRFAIGIGSQRAGTTLLHRLLRDSTDIFMHPVKELHYFDTLYSLRPESALKEFSQRQLLRQIDRLISADKVDFHDESFRCLLRTNKMLAFQDIKDIEYRDLFRPMLSQKDCLGEFTPEYMLLSSEQIECMANTIGRDSSIILLCRNPVDRVTSSAKLFSVYNGLNMNLQELQTWLYTRIEEGGAWINAQDRYNDYRRAVEGFSARFENFVAIRFEELTCSPENVIGKLESCLRVKINRKAFLRGASVKSNSLGESCHFETGLIKLLNQRYTDSTGFLEDYFRGDS